MNNISIIYITTPDQKTAKSIANELIDKKLAACVQIDGPMESIYRWEGTIENEQEYRCTIKSLSANYQKIEEIIVANHPYKTPQIVSVQVEKSLDAYSQWVIEQSS